MPPSLFPKSPELDGSSAEQKRAEILAYFLATFNRYETLFEVLQSNAAYYKKPIALRHPLIFYFGHTATFFVNKLLLAGVINARIDPRLESIFAVGVDEMSWDDLSEAHYDWPTVAEVKTYRQRVRVLVTQLIEGLPLSLPIGWSDPCWILLMAIEHERIHLETSSVLIRQHDLTYVAPHPAWPPCRKTAAAPHNELVTIAPTPQSLGRERTNPIRYGWDNEFGQHEAHTEAFSASRYLVSNHEFLAFVDANAYADTSLWSEEGARWQQFAHATHPTFWVKKGEQWYLRLMLEEIPMPWDWPVETNYHEARAFCAWKTRLSARTDGHTIRLPTEDEWHALASDLAETPANLALEHYAVDEFAHGALCDVVGNVWQWTETPIYPFDSFATHPIYDDFTVPTFDGRHNLIKGGSWISCGNAASPESRYAFRRHFFQHAGFRYVAANAPAPAETAFYESDRQLSEYAEFHYGDRYFGVDNFPRALADYAIAQMGDKAAKTALDLGCAVGRASFELARHFDKVIGIDFSTRFIRLGAQLAAHGRLRYSLVEEGELQSYKERSLAELGLSAQANNVEFFQGDACNLKPIFTGFDLILAANLIDRLYSPAQFLASIHQRLNAGGLLVIASPYTWLTEHTQRADWIGGFKKDGENFTTLDGLKKILSPHFTLRCKPIELPFVIRETKRKFQHTYAEVSVWEKTTCPPLQNP